MRTLPQDVELIDMYLHEREFDIPVVSGHKHLFYHFREMVKDQLLDGEIPVRFVVSQTDEKNYRCELGILAACENADFEEPVSIFHFIHRKVESTEAFNSVMIVPTGIGAEIGGHAGDAAPVVKLLSSICDTVVTHPNVVNASDINEIPENALYVEGSVLCRLMMGTVGLQPVRSNRVLMVIDNHEDEIFVNAAINSVNGARAAYGLKCPHVLKLNPPVEMSASYTASGRAVGRIERLELLFDVLEEYQSEYEGDMINPWGGVEAILTHSVSLMRNVPSAHSPMFESQKIANMDPGVVDPRMAAEAVSVSFLQCILKGLQKSPKIITDKLAIRRPGVFSASDISCLVIPDGCIGLPTLAALEQGIPVIAVRENKNIMKNDLAALPWASDQLYRVENYWEAVGVVAAIKAGIAPESVRRPVFPTHVATKSSATIDCLDSLNFKTADKSQT